MSVKDKWNLLRDIGFAAPRILKRVNDSRNLLEHEYAIPPESEVEDALDLATLFIEAGNRSVDSFSLGRQTEQGSTDYDFQFKNELICQLMDERFVIWGFKNTPDAQMGEVVNRRAYNVGSLEIPPSEPIFTDLVRLGVEVNRDVEERIKTAIHKLFETLERIAA
jgi:hypothetical protein